MNPFFILKSLRGLNLFFWDVCGIVCLEENKNLILAILENQNQGKLTECAQYQVIQKNLTYLAAVADAQPPPSTPSQPQASAAQPATTIQQQQQDVSGPRLPFQLNAHPSPHYQLMQFQQQ
ncbi:hypothetical protein LIER_18575 [Lithospermum erythrorhizon]|uniref:SS18 N-terminal domain-containing protein n=1 Tax=Lithospermum erythrorhizon TaxID=34254 RepID=A0AAV3QEN3_LITER